MLDAVNRIKDNRAMLINSSVHSAHQNWHVNFKAIRSWCDRSVGDWLC
jgi:hypothetical protein